MADVIKAAFPLWIAILILYMHTCTKFYSWSLNGLWVIFLFEKHMQTDKLKNYNETSVNLTDRYLYILILDKLFDLDGRHSQYLPLSSASNHYTRYRLFLVTALSLAGGFSCPIDQRVTRHQVQYFINILSEVWVLS